MVDPGLSLLAVEEEWAKDDPLLVVQELGQEWDGRS